VKYVPGTGAALDLPVNVLPKEKCKYLHTLSCTFQDTTHLSSNQQISSSTKGQTTKVGHCQVAS
jgi:hypothetical protein